jgi:hypothetical protein
MHQVCLFVSSKFQMKHPSFGSSFSFTPGRTGSLKSSSAYKQFQEQPVFLNLEIREIHAFFSRAFLASPSLFHDLTRVKKASSQNIGSGKA